MPYLDHKKELATKAAWRLRNQLHLQRYEQQRYAKRVEHRNEVAQWKRDHPEAKRQENERRKQRQDGATKNFTRKDRQRLWVQQEGLCGLCWTGMVEIEIDHIIPLCKGGPHRLDNAHVVHPECNRHKGRKTNIPLSTT